MADKKRRIPGKVEWAIRTSEELTERLDAYAQEHAGTGVPSRCRAAVMLIERGLSEATRKRKAG